MEPSLEAMYDHMIDLREHGVSEKSTDEMKKRIADSIITAYGAMKAEPVRIARSVLLPSRGKRNGRIYFSTDEAPVDTAAFINGTMTRYLDYNDTYLSKEAMHPSDNIPPLIALAYSLDMNGSDLIRAANMAYDVAANLSDESSIRDRGWDHVTYISISSAAGLSMLLDLDQRRFEHAISLSLNNNISMRQTRAGELSMWKGATTANACRNSVFGTLLAAEGFTGPSPEFSGEMGFFRQVSGPMNIRPKRDAVLRTMIKNYPVEYHAMSAAEAATSIHDEIKGEIKTVNVETFKVANDIIIKDPEKLRPRTRETADHSMPYIVAYSLVYGSPGPGSYEENFLKDSKILNVIDHSKYVVTERFNKMYPEYLPVKMVVETSSGKFEREMDVPKGHHRKPYTWDDLQEKGRKVMGDDNSKILMNVARRLEKVSVRELMEVISDVHFKG
ncbi:MAG: MmgE/PrpD family protein [Candidatus Thermoplasmatota archaeon]|jgi:2-methylcitrate dehydratase|nr:MmgE/PrpD family protein [Candidatus Thermoplasmatota archaeon]